MNKFKSTSILNGTIDGIPYGVLLYTRHRDGYEFNDTIFDTVNEWIVIHSKDIIWIINGKFYIFKFKTNPASAKRHELQKLPKMTCKILKLISESL